MREKVGSWSVVEALRIADGEEEEAEVCAARLGEAEEERRSAAGCGGEDCEWDERSCDEEKE